jgi:4-cresol dehydrogenase (hydroxylating)
MFTQSALGIVTRAAVWLMPRPPSTVTTMVTLAEDARFPALVEALRPLRLQGLLPSTMHCFNGLRLLGAVERFPYGVHDGRTSLDLAHPGGLPDLLRKHGLPAWACSACFGGPRSLVRAQVGALRDALRQVPGARVIALTAGQAGMLQRFTGALSWWPAMRRLRDQLAKFRAIASLQEGRPSRGTLVGGHWRGRGDPGALMDPLDSGAGMFWVSPLLPMTGAAAQEVMDLCRPLFHRFGFEYQVTFSMTSDRALCGVTTIPFDHASPEERERARACHDALVDALASGGFIPYRASAPTLARLRPLAPAHWDLLRRFGQVCDPDGVLAAGKWR